MLKHTKMILIAHRGNINGPIPTLENKETYLDTAISKGYEVEVDVWVKDNLIFMGHDEPQYVIDLKWFEDRLRKLWIHCKNIEAILFFKELKKPFNYFWHENDTITLTSNGFIWAYPGKQPIKNSIAVMPEINDDDLISCLGVCSDYVSKYTNL